MRCRKYLFEVAVLILVALCLISCEAEPSEFRASCSKVQAEFLARLETEKPISAVYYQNREISNRFAITDSEITCALAHALCEIQIGSPTDLYSTDYDDIFLFRMENGTEYQFSFNSHQFKTADGTCYTISNDAQLWKLAAQISEEAASPGT